MIFSSEIFLIMLNFDLTFFFPAVSKSKEISFVFQHIQESKGLDDYEYGGKFDWKKNTSSGFQNNKNQHSILLITSLITRHINI